MALSPIRQTPNRGSGSTTDSTSPRPTPSRSSTCSDNNNNHNSNNNAPSLSSDPNTYELQPLTHSTLTTDITYDNDDNDDDDVTYTDDNSLIIKRPRRLSFDSVQSYELYTPDEEKVVLRKLDRRLVGFMALLYCLSFLDRTSE